MNYFEFLYKTEIEVHCYMDCPTTWHCPEDRQSPLRLEFLSWVLKGIGKKSPSPLNYFHYYADSVTSILEIMCFPSTLTFKRQVLQQLKKKEIERRRVSVSRKVGITVFLHYSEWKDIFSNLQQLLYHIKRIRFEKTLLNEPLILRYKEDQMRDSMNCRLT